jgi:uncharacterized protein
MDGAMKTDFAFRSEGETLVGNLFLPERRKPIGVAVAVGPLTSVKEQAAGAYAQAMAEHGYAALAFDYRCFGESDGQPRQFENPEANIEDIRNAATALLADDRLTGQPLFGLGVCFGAGPMVRAIAEDSRFRAFAGVAGVYTDNAKTKATMGGAYQATIDRARAAERKWRETGEAETIRAVAPDGGDVAMPLREAYEFYGTPRGQVPNYVNGYARAVIRLHPAVRRARRGGHDQGAGPRRPLRAGVDTRPRSRLLCGCEIAQTGALASVAGADRLLR